MLTFLLMCAFGVAVIMGLLAIPFLLFGLLFRIITLPFRLFFGALGLVFGLIFGAVRVVLGLVGALLGVLFAPVVLGILAFLLVGALVVGLVSLLAPLLPFVVLGLLAWAIYRLVSRRPSPTF
jgi:hypothetical protein